MERVPGCARIGRMARFAFLALPRLLAAAATWAAAAVAQAQIYAGADADGTLVLSNHASDVATQLLIAAPPDAAAGRTEPASPAAADASPRSPLMVEIRAAAQRHDVPESLLAAVIAVESGFNAAAVSPKGAKGLMQLMPATARRFGVKDVFAVQENLNGGAAYLRWLLTQFDNDLRLTLAAYNAGEGAVARAGGRIPPYPETRDYVAKVLARMASR